MLELGDFSDHDIKVISELTADPDLDQKVADLEDRRAYAEMAWLTAMSDDWDRKFTVCLAIAVASANGDLDSIHITVPPCE